VVAPASAVPRHKNEYYKDDEEFLFKLAEALREEYKAIVDAGLMVQIDDAFLPYMYDVAFAADQLEQYREVGGGPRRGAQSRHRRVAGRPHPLSHLLGQL
jgi:methionine synthase II (cobalamin-independent)